MTISQTKVRARRLPGKVGQLYDASNLNNEIHFTNSNPQALEEKSLTVDTAADDRDYTVVINAVEVTITSGTGATTGSIATQLAEAINGEPRVRGQVAAEANADVVTLLATYPGMSFDASTEDANLTVADVTTAAKADAVPVGRLCIRAGQSGGTYPSRLGRVASASGLTAQSITLTVTGEATVILKIDGQLVEATAANAGALETALNSAVPANSVTATNDAGDVTIEVDTAGDAFKLVSVDGAAALSAQVQGDHIAELALGVSRLPYDEEVNKDGEIVYPPNAGVSALKDGRIWVEASASVSDGSPVYVQLTGDNAGKFYTTRAAGRALLTSSRASWFKDRSGDGLAVLACSFR